MRPVNPSAPPQTAPAVPDAAVREPRWQVRLLGTLEAGNGAQQLLRFQNWSSCCGPASTSPWAATACARPCPP